MRIQKTHCHLRNMSAILGLLVLALARGPAIAQEIPAATEPTTYRSPGTAQALAVTGILVPVGLVALTAKDEYEDSGEAILPVLMTVGAIIGPGLGHIYAGDSGGFWKGTGVRTLCFGGMIGALALSWDEPDRGGAKALFYGSAGLYLYSSVRDILSADDAARATNQRLGLQVAPTLGAHDSSMGLVVGLRF